jgi:hypothetical protein
VSDAGRALLQGKREPERNDLELLGGTADGLIDSAREELGAPDTTPPTQAPDRIPINEAAEKVFGFSLGSRDAALRHVLSGLQRRDLYERFLAEPRVASRTDRVTSFGGGASKATAKDWDSALKILSEMPQEWRALAETLKASQALGNYRPREMEFDITGPKLTLPKAYSELTDADIAFANLVVRAYNDGQTVMRAYLDRAANLEAFGRGGTLDQAAINLMRGYHAKIMENALSRGWLMEAPDGTLTITPKMRLLAEIVDTARWREKGYEWKPKTKDWYPTLNGDNGLFDRRCSDCTLYWRRLYEKAREMPGRMGRGMRHAAKALIAENRAVAPFVGSYAYQWSTPEHDRFRRAYISRVMATLRNRYGDPLGTILGKANDEKLIARQHYFLAVKQAFGRDYKDVPEVYEIEDIEKIEDPVIRAKALELTQIADALEGKYDPAKLGPAARRAYEKSKGVYEEARALLAGHIFRRVRRTLEEARDTGAATPQYLFRHWADLIGEDEAASDPTTALARLNARVTTRPGETWTVAGMSGTGWGLRDYFPRIWGKTQHQGDGMHFVLHPSNMPNGDDLETGGQGSAAPGEIHPKWSWQFANNFAKEHGFMHRTKFMRNLLHRVGDKDGYIPDPRWVMRQYLGSMIDKVWHERLTDDLDPFLFGTYKPLADQATDVAKLRELLTHVPKQSESDRLGSIGSIDEYFSLKASGALQVGKRFVFDPGRGDWVEAAGLDQEQIASERLRWRTERWRVSMRHSSFEGSPEDWSLAVSTGGEMFKIKGIDNIRRAGIEIRTGGTQNFSTGDSYNAIKDVVRKMAGYDMDSGKWDNWMGPKSALGRIWSKASDALNEVFYQAMLGGSWLNPKAFMVQAIEGTAQNLASLDAKAWGEAVKDSQGAMGFYNAWLFSKNPEEKFEQMKLERANTPFVSKVLPVLEAGQWRPWHLLRTDPWHKGRPTPWYREQMETARRRSYAAFTVGDVVTKIHAYYGAWKRAAEVGTWTNPTNGRTVRVIPEYIPAGDTFTHGPDVISAHDIARMVVDRTHFTLPTWAQPGLMQIPLWRTFGHLGTQAANISFEMLYGLQEMWKVAEGRPDANEFMAQRASRYVIGMALAFSVAAALGWDLGDYTGAHVSEVGIGDATLGDLIPQTKDLGYHWRFWGYQLPTRTSLPAKFWFGEPGVGVFRTAADLGQRATSGVLGPMEAVQTGLDRWFRNWSNVLLPWPNARVGRHVMDFAAGGAAYTGADPDHPWEITGSPVYGRKKRVKYRSTAEMIGEVLFPGRPIAESLEYHNARAAVERLGVRGRMATELRRHLTHPDAEVREDAIEKLRSMGVQLRGWRTKRMALAERLTTAEAMFMELDSLKDRAGMFIELAPELNEERKSRMWEAIMGPGTRLGQLSPHARKDFDADLRSRLMEAAR